MKTLNLVSLGCARNLVDSEMMREWLAKAGWTVTEEPDAAEVIVVNTCSFIEAAVNESIDTILALSKYKKTGACRRLIVAGCLPERYREEIEGALPEVDLFLGTGAFDRIVQAVEGRLDGAGCLLPDPNRAAPRGYGSPALQGGGGTAHVKIAEGCDRHCTYCIIPKLRGAYRSRPRQEIVAQCRELVAGGVKELVLVSQDTTGYGADLTPAADLGGLLAELSTLSREIWIRFLYGHPESMDTAVIQTVADHPNLCRYFDIPIQHASDPVLRRMGRNHTQADLIRLFDTVRSEIPDAALRTTVMVGFPGETQRDFDRLMDFIQRVRFDHLGCFLYSDGEDLPSHTLDGPVPKKTAQARHDALMACQAEISTEKNETYLDTVVQVLVEERSEAGLYVGRTAFQAPEVDGLTYVHGRQLQVGEFTPVRITDTLEYDLVGDVP